MTTLEGDLNIFLLAVFLFVVSIILPAVIVVLMAWVTRDPPRPEGMVNKGGSE